VNEPTVGPPGGLQSHMSEVTVRYFSRHLLRTIDLNYLVARLVEVLPDFNRLVIEEMDEDEKSTAAQTDKHGIVMVLERLYIYVGENGSERRRDLEEDVERNVF
jgi:hypothetical protein